jgi:glycosyltransferase involved in cell wall biosynthesis
VALQRQESLVSRCVDLGFVCSDDDGRSLATATGKALQISVIPNGVACERSPFDSNPHKKQIEQVLFCGTLSYRPNIDGLNWFLQNVWPVVLRERPQLRLQIVGRGYHAGNFPLLATASSVDVIGEVDDVAPYYRSSGIAICPLLSGSGTRLKILEAMSFGNPVLSTSIGCEGLQMIHGSELMIHDDAEGFANALLKLQDDGNTFDALRTQARHRVEELYDWRVVGNTVKRSLIDALKTGISGNDEV